MTSHHCFAYRHSDTCELPPGVVVQYFSGVFRDDGTLFQESSVRKGLGSRDMDGAQETTQGGHRDREIYCDSEGTVHYRESTGSQGLC